MANPFDEFDHAPNAALLAAGANPFDEFDEKPVPVGDISHEANPKKEGFFSRVGSDISKRNEIAQEIGRDYNAGKINKVSEILQLAGNSGAGVINDIGAEALKSAGHGIAAVAPQFMKDNLHANLGALLQSDIGKAGIDALHSGVEKWDAFKQVHPEAAGNIAALGNLVGVAAPMAKAADFSVEAAPAIARNVGIAAKDTAKGIGGAGDILKTGYNARYGEALDNISKPIKQSSSASYKAMRDAGADVNHDAVLSIVNKMYQDVSDTGLVDPALHPKTISIMKRLQDEAEQGPMSVERLEQYRQLLGDAVSSDTSKIDGMGKDGFKSMAAMRSLDDSIEKLSENQLTNNGKEAIEALKDGRAKWAQASKVDTITRILKQADGNPNKIKVAFSKLADSGMKGFNQKEKMLIRQAAKNTTGEKLLKLFGKLGLDLGGDRTYGNALIPGMEIAGALYTHSPVGAAPVIAGTVAKQGQKYLARGKAEKVLQALENRGAPVVEGAENIPAPKSPIKPINLEKSDLTGLAGPIAHTLPPSQETPFQLPPSAMETLQRGQAIADKAFAAPDAAPPAAPILDSIKKAESGGNTNAKNPLSSAVGPYQFTVGTWRDMISKHPETNLTMADRAKPEAQEIMMPLLIADNSEILQGKTGRAPSSGDIYAAHVLGPHGAAKLINAPPKTPANTLFPDKVIKANRRIFLDGTRPRTAEEVYRLLANKVETA